jgi:hypothetical protein
MNKAKSKITYFFYKIEYKKLLIFFVTFVDFPFILNYDFSKLKIAFSYLKLQKVWCKQVKEK